MRNARLCRLLAEQGTDVVCATISLFHEVQRWNRENIPVIARSTCEYRWMRCGAGTAKGIYAGAQRGEFAGRGRLGRGSGDSGGAGPDTGQLRGARRWHRGRSYSRPNARRAGHLAVGPARPLASKPRRNRWRRWLRFYATGGSCRRFASRSVSGARMRAACWLPSCRALGFTAGSSCEAVPVARTAPGTPRLESTIPCWEWRAAKRSDRRSSG